MATKPTSSRANPDVDELLAPRRGGGRGKGTKSVQRAGPATDPTPVAAAVQEQVVRIQLPEKLEFLFCKARYKVAHGGRGGAKSWGFALALLLQGSQVPLRILCARELQVSISESVHKLLIDTIQRYPLAFGGYTWTKNSIVHADTGTEFYFSGIRNNVTKIKSMEGIDIVWVEEAEKVSDNSWQVLIPTIRKPGSEIWVSFNPDLESDATSSRFLKNPPPNALVVQIGWEDNPWFPEELRLEKDYLYRVDPEAAEHVWGGKFRTNSAAAVLRGKWRQEAFIAEPTWEGPFWGADFGFSVDPSTLVKCFIDPKENILYIDAEAWGVGVEIDQLPAFYDSVKGAREAHAIRADSARPETISYLQRNGYGSVRGVVKWSGSVEDGIAFLRGFKAIVIHSRCKHAAEEARLYCYKIDLNGDVTTIVVDKHNHIWDAVRYALEPQIRQFNMGFLHFMKAQANKAHNAPGSSPT
jgi:phage terminase large subunit